MPALLCSRALVHPVRGIFFLLEGSTELDDESRVSEPEAEFHPSCPFVEAGSSIGPPHRTRNAGANILSAAVEKAFRSSREQLDFYRCEESGEYQEITTERNCPRAPEHVTERFGPCYQVDLFGGPILSAWILVLGSQNIAIRPFCEELIQAGFTGVRFTECPVAVFQTMHRPPPLCQLEATGRNCQLPTQIVGGENLCPFCGWGPIVCEECGERSDECRQCEKQVLVPLHIHQGEADRRIAIKPAGDWKNTLIIDASRWHGEDFINCRGSTVVTRRVIDWLKALPAGPWVAYPLQAELAGLPTEMVPRLLEVAGSQRRHVERLLRPK
jgi:hypothetical protein